MTKMVNILLAIFLSFCAAYGQEAKTLPELPADPAISSGKLPNGVSYYFASDKSSKGIMNVSLVQKMDSDMPVDDLVEAAGSRFSAVTFGDVTLDGFLGRNGMLPSEKGYIECRKGSVTYRINGLAAPRGDAVLDTVLLSIFTLAQAAAENGQPSSSQAIVVAGDFNQGTILSKMKTLCLINPFVPGAVPEREYEKPSGGRSDITVEGGALAKVSVHWEMAHTPSKYMATVLPVVSGKMSAELRRLLLGRIYSAYRVAGADVWIDAENEDAFSGCGDESMTISVNCLRRESARVREIFAKELERLYAYGIDAKEYAYVRDANKYAWIARSKSLRPDVSAAAEKCRAAFLCGASLSSDTERIRFAYRDLPDSVQTRIFNNFMRGVLGQTVKDAAVRAPESVFEGREAISERLSAYGNAAPLKAPKDKEEYMTGGVIWTFSNGLNVIYRKMDTKGLLYYSFAAKGGRQYADGGVFNTIDSVSEEEFGNYLASEGVEMDLALNPADVRLYGKAPLENAPILMQALSAIAGNSANKRVFGSDTYKLLVVVGDMDQDKFKKMMRCYAVGLGQGSRWKAVKYTDENTDDFLNVRRYTLYDSVFPFDVTAYNYAVASVAYYGLQDKLGSAFSDSAVSFLHEQDFMGFPLNNYRLKYGVRNVSTDHFSSMRSRLGEGLAQLRVDAVISDLAAGGIDSGKLPVYKQLAKNEFASWRALPEYYIHSAMDRYLNNKDLMSRFDSQVDAVSAESLKSFYAAAAASDR